MLRHTMLENLSKPPSWLCQLCVLFIWPEMYEPFCAVELINIRCFIEKFATLFPKRFSISVFFVPDSAYALDKEVSENSPNCEA